MNKANNHPTTVILRNWTKDKKVNSPVIAEIHTKDNKAKGD